MKIDINLPEDPARIADAAAAAEQAGFDAGWVSETQHDSLISLTLAAARTTRLSLGSAITVAFARSPMVTALAANDVQVVTQGRLLLGLGSQVRAHVVNRFSMPWSAPAARMAEYIAALRAIWSSWNDAAPLNFRGDFYTHTLMTPLFAPAPNPYGPPRVFVAAVGEQMTEVAGAAADGIICHPFTTERYLREVTRPALQRGRERAAGTADPASSAEPIEVSVTPFVVTGTTAEQFAQAKAAARQRIAVYGSTPAYRGVLERHGWGDLQTELRAMARDGRWDQLGSAIDDEVLAAFAIVAEPERLAAAITTRFGELADRVSLAIAPGAEAAFAPAVAALLAR